MKVYDISLTLSHEIPAWPGDCGPEFKKLLEMSKGEMCNITAMKMTVHTGTHVDAPCHFVDGATSSETIPLKTLIGPALVVEALDAEHITKDVLMSLDIPPNIERLLIKTRNSNEWVKGNKEFKKDYVAISKDGAQLLVDRGVKLIGVDYLSVAPFHDLVPTHEILLKNEVVILEGTNLSKVPPGHYTLYCLPLKIKGADGAPTRAVLIE